MIIYSVTVSIDQAVEQEWLALIGSSHIPDVLATGHFSEHEIFKVLEPSLHEGKVTYVIHYRSPSLQSYHEYQATAAPRLQAEHTARFGGRFVTSRMLLAPVDSDHPDAKS